MSTEVPARMRILITTAILVARAIYAVLGLLPRRNKVVMLSRQANRPSKDFTLLAAELRRRDPSLEVAVRCRFIRSGFIARVAYVGEVLVQMYHLATSRACVLDSYSVPLSILNHRDDLFVVQMWHALGAIKKFGYQSIGQPGGRSAGIARDMRMHRNYDVVLCGGPGSVETFAAAFDVDPHVVLPLGLPRVDYLRDATSARSSSDPVPTVAALHARYPRLADGSKTVVLYVPTFRHHGGDAFRNVIDAFASENFTLVVKPHDLDSATVPEAHVVDATGVEVLDLLPICDVVVTDYSAVAFEASCIDKPVYFYVHDIEEYQAAQGLNINPIEALPSVSSTRIEDLVSRIAELDYNAEVAKAFLEDFAPAKNVVCTSEIANLILLHLRGPQ
jgi:CDP-ribitol ribitolphosphotransferase